MTQGVSEAIIKAMTAVGCLKPKYPFITIQKSALIYVALYLKGELDSKGAHHLINKTCFCN